MSTGNFTCHKSKLTDRRKRKFNHLQNKKAGNPEQLRIKQA